LYSMLYEVYEFCSSALGIVQHSALILGTEQYSVVYNADELCSMLYTSV
jgi:hypothetical protein